MDDGDKTRPFDVARDGDITRDVTRDGDVILEGDVIRDGDVILDGPCDANDRSDIGPYDTDVKSYSFNFSDFIL